VCDLAEALVFEELDRQLLALTQAALIVGVAPPDAGSAHVWLTDWLNAVPEKVDPDKRSLLRAIGLRR
jgi:hypothetical protein